MMAMRLFLVACCCVVTVAGLAQKKELNQAEAYLKSGKDFEKAEKLMTDLLKNPKNRTNKKIYKTWYQSVVAQYEAANEKLYLRQKYDTAKFFHLVKHMYFVAEALDSVDARPDKKGRVRPDYRKKNAEQLDMLRNNLFNGGSYQLRKGDYDMAYGYYETYLDAARQPLFKAYDYMRKDTMMPQVAYWATICAYRLERPDSVLRYAEVALRDTSRRDFILQYVCEAYRWKNQDTAYVAALNRGFDEFPEHPYFFPRLADWYTAHQMPDSVLVVAERGLKVNPDNQLFLLAKSVAQLNLGDDEGCVETSERLIALNDTLPEAYFNLATVYLNKALAVEMENEPRKNRKVLKELYERARPNMEMYRKLLPEDSKRWAPGLYRIYLNLNMGKQFDEIDRILRKENN